jgi:hypothetical protein
VGEPERGSRPFDGRVRRGRHGGAEALDRVRQVAQAGGQLGPLELQPGELLAWEGGARGELEGAVDLLARRPVGVQRGCLAGDVAQRIDRPPPGVGLVQVIGDRRIATAAGVDRDRLPRIGDHGVQALAVAPQQPVVGDRLHERVAEHVGGFVALVVAQQPRADEPLELRQRVGRVGGAQQHLGRSRGADRGDELQRVEGGFGEAVELTAHELLDRGWNGGSPTAGGQPPAVGGPLDRSLLRQVVQQLGCEERVAAGVLEQQFDEVVAGSVAEHRPRELGEPRATEGPQLGSHRARSAGVEHASHAIVSAVLVGAGGDDQTHPAERSVLCRVGQLAHQVDRRLVGPVEVVDHDHDRRPVGDELDHATVERPPAGGGARAGALLRLGRFAGEPRRQPLVRREGGDDRTPGRVRPAAVRRARAEHPTGTGDGASGDLGDERRLAHAGFPDQRQHTASSCQPLELGELLDAPDGGARHVTAAAHHVVAPAHESPRLDRLGLALHRDRSDVLQLEPGAAEPHGELADVDLPGRGGSLQPLGHVHRVAEHRVGDVGGGAGEASDGVPGVDSDVHRQALGDLRQHLPQGVELGEHVERARQRPLGVVLGRRRQPEPGEQRVAGVVQHRAAMAGHDVAETGDHGVDDLAERLRVDLFGERREARDVGEQGGDQTPLLAWLTETGEPRLTARRRGAAVAAEARAIGVLP